MISVRKEQMLSLALAFILITGINGGCADRDEAQPDSGSFTGFLSKVGCTLQTGVEKVSEGVNDGVRYIKNKVTTSRDDDSMSRQAEDASDVNGEISRIGSGSTDYFKTVRGGNIPLAQSPQSPNGPESLDDRNAFTSPHNCRDNEVFDDGKCRERAPSRFNKRK